MRLLALFAARRAVACWQLYCDDTSPLDGVRTAERVLEGRLALSAKDVAAVMTTSAP